MKTIKRPTTDAEALELALTLAITAPDAESLERVMKVATHISDRMSLEDVLAVQEKIDREGIETLCNTFK